MSSDLFLNILIWVIIASISYLVYKKSKVRDAEILRKKEENERKIETDYKQALLGTDKAKALELGRIFYSHKRGGGNLTIYDEQALTNDLSTMK